MKAGAVKLALGISDSWLSKARKVVEILQEIGPDGKNPDLMVTARMNNRNRKKGVELYRFLLDRRDALEAA